MWERLVTSEIPQPRDKLVLMDLDKTLIDGNYQITDAGIFEAVKRVQSLGWQLGLSSATPLKPLEKWMKEFGMNGPIIAERGALLKLPEGAAIELVPHMADYFTEVKKHLVSLSKKIEIPFYYGDATAFLRNTPKLTGLVDGKLFLINPYRKCSLSFFGRDLNGEGGLTINNALVETIISILRPLLDTAPFELEEDFNPDYGIYIVSPKVVNKRVATMRLMDEMQLEQVGMIGDSGADIIGSDIAIHYAVGNAKDALKNQADFVSGSDYTSGVIEILSQLK